jgi:hypothetical protein
MEVLFFRSREGPVRALASAVGVATSNVVEGKAKMAASVVGEWDCFPW